MNPSPAAVLPFVESLSDWRGDWAWGVLLIVFTIVIHVCGLLLISEKIDRVQTAVAGRYTDNALFVMVIAVAALLATTLHWFEGMIWATAFLMLGALQDASSAVLYSLSAMTSYGHEHVVLASRWRLLGALEALNGMLLFGLTTATLIGIIQRARSVHGGKRRRD
jgi:Ni/Fe-hydrogenase subunit HybB-like protein